MLPKDTSIISLALALVFSGMVGSAGYKAFEAMKQKADSQVQAVKDFEDWKQQYTRLLPVEEKWSKTLRPLSEVKDLYSLYLMLGEVPRSDPDSLLVEKLERVKQNEQEIGADKVCITSGGGMGVTFIEKDFGTLMAGLDQLSKRPDVQMGSVRISQEKASAKAVVSPLCLLVRDDEKVKAQ